MELRLLIVPAVDDVGFLTNISTKAATNKVDSLLTHVTVNPVGRYLLLLTQRLHFDFYSNEIAASDESLTHFNFGFSLILDKDESFLNILFADVNGMLFTRLTEESYIISNSLSGWKRFVVSHSKFKASETTTHKFMRKLGNQILLHFELMGLSFIWRDYRKESIADGTFTLKDIKS